jgi:DNA-binding response OmpR family regulator
MTGADQPWNACLGIRVVRRRMAGQTSSPSNFMPSIRAQEALTGGDLPIILVTAHSLALERATFLERDTDNYIVRPICGPELSDTIASTLFHRNNHKGLEQTYVAFA